MNPLKSKKANARFMGGQTKDRAEDRQGGGGERGRARDWPGKKEVCGQSKKYVEKDVRT